MGINILIIILEIVLLSLIDGHWEDKIAKDKNKKRKCRAKKGLVFLSTAVISFFLVGYIGQMIYLYTIVAFLSGIGSLLSAINPNLREMYMALVVSGVIIGGMLFFFGNNIVVIIISALFIIGSMLTVAESIQNMKNGIDPDEVAEQKAERNKLKRQAKNVFKIVRLAFKFVK